MTVDFELKRAPSLRVATVSWTGKWTEKAVQKLFDQLADWAKKESVRTGSYIFTEDRARNAGKDQWKFTVGVEVKGKPARSAGVRFRTLPASRVASVSFDPEEVSPRVVYHGLNDWTRWRKKDGEIKGVKSSREVYPGHPWRDAKAWSRTEIQYVVK